MYMQTGSLKPSDLRSVGMKITKSTPIVNTQIAERAFVISQEWVGKIKRTRCD